MIVDDVLHIEALQRDAHDAKLGALGIKFDTLARRPRLYVLRLRKAEEES
jgi:hypothetical protein